MDLSDLEKDMGSMKIPPRASPGKQVNLNAKNAGLKIIVLRALAFVFLAILLIFSIYTMMNADTTKIDRTLLLAILFVLVAGGAFVSLKLWSLEYAGWLFMLLICLAGIAMPAFSAYNHGALAVGTVPIIAASVVGIILLWYVKDVLGIRKFSDIFSPH